MLLLPLPLLLSSSLPDFVDLPPEVDDPFSRGGAGATLGPLAGTVRVEAPPLLSADRRLGCADDDESFDPAPAPDPLLPEEPFSK